MIAKQYKIDFTDMSEKVVFSLANSKTCTKCHKLYVSQSYLEQHIKSAHPEDISELPGTSSDFKALTVKAHYQNSGSDSTNKEAPKPSKNIKSVEILDTIYSPKSTSTKKISLASGNLNSKIDTSYKGSNSSSSCSSSHVNSYTPKSSSIGDHKQQHFEKINSSSKEKDDQKSPNSSTQTKSDQEKTNDCQTSNTFSGSTICKPPVSDVIIVLSDSNRCKFCNKTYVSQDFLNKHIRDAHSEKVNVSPTQSPFVIKRVSSLSNIRRQKVVKKILRHHANALNKNYKITPKPRTAQDSSVNNKNELPEGIKSASNSSNRKQKKFLCSICNRSFVSANSVLRHMKKCSQTLTKKGYNFICSECGLKFSEKHSIRMHKNRVHKLTRDLKLNFKCPLCPVQKHYKKVMVDHLIQDHNISMEMEKLQFSSIEEFEVWKANHESATNCEYTKDTGLTKISNGLTRRYVCIRSGNLVSKSKGIRRARVNGSIKMNAFCPSNMTLIIEENGQCELTFIKTHVGHDHLRPLFKSREQVLMLKKKIEKNTTSFSSVLDNVRKTVASVSINRLDFLTKQDLQNIESSFSLFVESDNIVVTHDIEAWINELSDYSKSCVLFFKPRNAACDIANLDNTFILILMNETQEDLISKNGSDCICMDYINSTNDDDLKLITLMVRDEFREGFPGAFLITNRLNTEVITHFLDVIKKKTGSISPRVFMSNLDNLFLNAWESVMKPPEVRLYSTWEVDSDWRKNLNKISETDKQIEVYRILRTMMEKKDKASYDEILKVALDMFSKDNDLKLFGDYFTEKYKFTGNLWAGYNRVNVMKSGFDINFHFERTRQMLQFVYLHPNHNGYVTRAMQAIMRYLRDKIVDCVPLIYHGKIFTIQKHFRLDHKKSFLPSKDCVVVNRKNHFLVQSYSSENNIVEKKCQDCTCLFACSDCKACIHAFSCTCSDSCMNWTMCKHIHILGTYLRNTSGKSPKGRKSKKSLQEVGNMIAYHDNENEHAEAATALMRFGNNVNVNRDPSLWSVKQDLKDALSNLIDDAACEAELEVIRTGCSWIQENVSCK